MSRCVGCQESVQFVDEEGCKDYPEHKKLDAVVEEESALEASVEDESELQAMHDEHHVAKQEASHTVMEWGSQEISPWKFLSIIT